LTAVKWEAAANGSIGDGAAGETPPGHAAALPAFVS
jgi:hypothetical protein